MRTYLIMGLLSTCGVLLGLFLFPRLPTTTLSIKPTAPSSPTEASSQHSLAAVYLVLSPECPISNSYLPKLNKLQEYLREQGVELIGVVPAVSASRLVIEEFRNKFKVDFPIILDQQQKLCSELQATHTPQAIVVDARGEIVYSGRIDDRFSRIAGQQREMQHDSLRLAIDCFLAGQMPEQSRTTAIGCRIESPPTSNTHHSVSPANTEHNTVVFTQDIAPLLFAHCSRCHRLGEAAPFALLTYEDATRHGTQIREVIRQGLMPPWKPTSGFGKFKNEHRLANAEIKTISKWVESGMPRGPDSAMPSPPQFPTGWQLGTPDLELVMPEAFDVPADGPDIYRHFVIPIGLTKNRLISGFEFRPGAPEVVHHATTFYDTSGKGRELDAADPGPGYSRVGTPGFVVSGSLGGWGPGGLPNQLPVGMGRPLMKNADLIIQIHYHPSGRVVKDQSRIGLYFAPEWADRLVTEVMVAKVNLVIPANQSEYLHQAEWTLPVDTILLDATPHMHVLGKKIQAVAILPNGERMPLIQINDWDFYWQDSYAFDKPVELPAGTRIQVDCIFDNSAGNPQNPNLPPQDVYWGDFSDDEMGICYFQATTKSYGDYVILNATSKANFQTEWDSYLAQKESRQQNDAEDK